MFLSSGLRGIYAINEKAFGRDQGLENGRNKKELSGQKLFRE